MYILPERDFLIEYCKTVILINKTVILTGLNLFNDTFLDVWRYK